MNKELRIGNWDGDVQEDPKMLYRAGATWTSDSKLSH